VEGHSPLEQTVILLDKMKAIMSKPFAARSADQLIIGSTETTSSTGQLWEALLHQVQFDFYSAHYHRCPPEWRNVPRITRDEMLHFVHRGVIRWRIGSEEFEVPAGSVVVCPPQLEWEAWRVSDELIHVSVVHFDAYFPGGQRYLPTLGYDYRITPPEPKHTANTIQALNRTFAESAPGHALKERAQLLELFHQLFPYRAHRPANGSPSDEVLQIIAFLRDHLHEPITRETLARRFHLSSGHLASVFKGFTGQSPINYLLHLRIEQASRLLASTSLSVTEISHRVGYDDPAYFSRIFKQQQSISPQQYRQEAALRR
jgi:AraC-like DNA-binding protein